jgi:hypothetical protein
MSFQVTGQVVDNSTGAGLPGATVQDLTNSVNNQETDGNGNFTITVPNNTTPCSITLPGYIELDANAGALLGVNKLLPATATGYATNIVKNYWWVILLVVLAFLIVKYKPGLLK